MVCRGAGCDAYSYEREAAAVVCVAGTAVNLCGREAAAVTGMVALILICVWRRRGLLLVTDEDLSEMEIPKGPRLKLLNAAAALRMLESGAMSSDEEVEPPASEFGEMTEAERRAAHQAEMDSLFEKMRQEEQQQTADDGVRRGCP